jgi:hypothetical protein
MQYYIKADGKAKCSLDRVLQFVRNNFANPDKRTGSVTLSPGRNSGQMETLCEDDICLLEPRHFLARNIVVSCYEFLKYDLSCQLYCGHQLRYGLAYLHQPALVMPAGDLKIIHLEMKKSMRIPAETYNQR